MSKAAKDGKAARNRVHAAGLLLLTSLFGFRVLAQLAQAVLDLPFLPAFAAWHSGALPYPLLVAAQAAILAAGTVLALRVGQGRLAPDRRWAGLCLGLGGLYFAMMAFRLVAGLTVLADVHWFARPLPAFFHMVLASYLLLLGLYLRPRAQRRANG